MPGSSVLLHNNVEVSRLCFAKIDFVDFITRRDFFNVDLTHYISDPDFRESAYHFLELVVNLDKVTERLKSKFKALSLDHPPISIRRLPKLISLIAYRGLLPSSDTRHLCFPADGDLRIQERNDLTSTYMKFTSDGKSKYILSYSEVQRLDGKEYLEHWSKAFPDVLETILNDNTIRKRIMLSSDEQGIDSCLQDISYLIDNMQVPLPFLDSLLKNQLLAGIYTKIHNRLIVAL